MSPMITLFELFQTNKVRKQVEGSSNLRQKFPGHPKMKTGNILYATTQQPLLCSFAIFNNHYLQKYIVDYICISRCSQVFP
jgi:hypothetical protein